jgi:hypothetical protein
MLFLDMIEQQEVSLRIVRFETMGKIKYGVLEGDVVHGLRQSPFTGFKGTGGPVRYDGNDYKFNEIRLLSPCLPSKIVRAELPQPCRRDRISDTIGSTYLPQTFNRRDRSR